MRRALLSVSDKTGLIDLARGLRARGFELVSTGGTARALTDAGLEVRSVSEVTGFPELMEGRVKTLHPLVHGGILARRGHAHDLESAREHGIGLIDLVCVNLYPFAHAAARPGITFEALIEQVDVGGPTLIRAAAKNFVDVLVLVSPADYDLVLGELDQPGGPGLSRRLELATRAFAHTAEYDRAIASTLATIRVEEQQLVVHAAEEELLPARFSMQLTKIRDLRYGENPHQAAAWYAAGSSAQGLAAPVILQGKELSFTNLLDLDAAARLVLDFEETAAVVVKHTNPCGVATADRLADAYALSRDADALAAFGGIVGVNRVIDEETAHALVSTFIEAVIAPGVADAARAILAAKPNLRVVTADFSAFSEGAARAGSRRELRSVLGALLVQARDRVFEASAPWPTAEMKVVTRRPPTAEEWRALRFAWRIVAHVKSNSVIFSTADRTLAIGAGQMSRVDAVQLATMKATAWGGSAGQPLAGSVAASDAFFPFRDGLDAVAAAGATAVVQPGGSVRDQEVIAAADEHGLAMVFTATRHFRH